MKAPKCLCTGISRICVTARKLDHPGIWCTYLDSVPIKSSDVVNELDLSAVVPVGEEREEDLAIKVGVGNIACLDPHLQPQAPRVRLRLDQVCAVEAERH